MAEWESLPAIRQMEVPEDIPVITEEDLEDIPATTRTRRFRPKYRHNLPHGITIETSTIHFETTLIPVPHLIIPTSACCAGCIPPFIQLGSTVTTTASSCTSCHTPSKPYTITNIISPTCTQHHEDKPYQITIGGKDGQEWWVWLFAFIGMVVFLAAVVMCCGRLCGGMRGKRRMEKMAARQAARAAQDGVDPNEMMQVRSPEIGMPVGSVPAAMMGHQILGQRNGVVNGYGLRRVPPQIPRARREAGVRVTPKMAGAIPVVKKDGDKDENDVKVPEMVVFPPLAAVVGKSTRGTPLPPTPPGGRRKPAPTTAANGGSLPLTSEGGSVGAWKEGDDVFY